MNITDKTKICFVVMGFGKKTDFETSRLLDLDATYEAIIQPAVEDCNIRCIRANEILHSGVIDEKMYDMLLRADLVIADISTGNVNAVYELGVRHALRPFSTIIMKENKGQLHFDLNHVSTFMYEHMESDIGTREAKRARKALKELIEQTMDERKNDSPVYTFIPNLAQPVLTDKEFEEVLEEAEELQDSFSGLLHSAEEAKKASEHGLAAKNYSELLELRSNDPYIRQQAALHTYKAKHPSRFLALNEAIRILEPLKPEVSNDPETLGISGAIYKNLWEITSDLETLNKSIHFYNRGFDLRGDYYNGENAATCIEIRSGLQKDQNEKLFDEMTANKIRQSIIHNLQIIIEDNDFDERSDRQWVYATLSNCNLSLGNDVEAQKYEQLFYCQDPSKWEIDTYIKHKPQ